jgi:hypothetical protein
MSDVLLTVTVFHTVAAVAVFGLMVFSAIKLVQDQRSRKQ